MQHQTRPNWKQDGQFLQMDPNGGLKWTTSKVKCPTNRKDSHPIFAFTEQMVSTNWWFDQQLIVMLPTVHGTSTGGTVENIRDSNAVQFRREKTPVVVMTRVPCRSHLPSDRFNMI